MSNGSENAAIFYVLHDDLGLKPKVRSLTKAKWGSREMGKDRLDFQYNCSQIKMQELFEKFVVDMRLRYVLSAAVTRRSAQAAV